MEKDTKNNKKKCKLFRAGLIGMATLFVVGVGYKSSRDVDVDALGSIKVEKTILDDIKKTLDDTFTLDSHAKEKEKDSSSEKEDGSLATEKEQNSKYENSTQVYHSRTNDGRETAKNTFSTYEQDSVKPGDDSQDLVKPGDDSQDPVKPGDDSQDPVKPGDDPQNPVKPGDDPQDPVKPEHNHDLKEVVVKEATYNGKNAQGQDTHYVIAHKECVAGDYTGPDYIIASECDYGEWKSNGAAGEVRECKVCGHQDTNNHDLKEVIVGQYTYKRKDEQGRDMHCVIVHKECATCDYVGPDYEKEEECNIHVEMDDYGTTAHCDICNHSEQLEVHAKETHEVPVTGNPDVCYTSYIECTIDGCTYHVDLGSTGHNYTTVVDYDDWANPTRVQKECSHVYEDGSKCTATAWFDHTPVITYSADSEIAPRARERVMPECFHTEECTDTAEVHAEDYVEEITTQNNPEPAIAKENIEPQEEIPAPVEEIAAENNPEPAVTKENVEPQEEIPAPVEEIAAENNPEPVPTLEDADLDALVASIWNYRKTGGAIYNESVEKTEELGAKTLVLRSRC